MRLGQRKKGGRKEPTFDGAASLGGLRLTRQDRVPRAGDDDDKPRRSSRRVVDEDEDDAPARRVRKTRAQAKAEARAEAKADRRRSAKGRSRRSRGNSRSAVGRLFYWTATLGLWAIIAGAGAIVWVGAHLPSIQTLEIPKRPPTIQIAGSDGTIIATRGEMPGVNISLKDLPAYLPQAFVAIEDKRFYSHFGIDPTGILRAAVTNILHRGVAQGGSTLTQQLAKNIFLTQERTMQRKLQEVELALWLERKYSKSEIIELYLNRVYFGSGAYGIEAAALKYFGKPARNVSIGEAAMLAGLVKSPSRLAPNRNPQGAENRMETVLAAMVHSKFINDTQADAAKAKPPKAVQPAGAGTVNYVADWIGDVMDDLVGQVEQNIVVETSIDPALQSVAEAAIIDELAAKSVKFNVTQGALVAMTPDGSVVAMVGGRNYGESQFNRAVTARRQPGSSFKPFVYLTALEAGLTPDTVRQDAPLDVKGWRPENYSREYFGPVTLTQALSNSLNTVAVRLGLEVGPANVVRTAHRLGIASKLDTNASIALGTSEVSLTELVGAYAPFANGGRAASPHVISKIRTQDGKTLYVRNPDPPAQVIDPRYAGMMNAMMHETLVAGTARKAELPGWQAAGKTGTSQDFRDAWFIGYTSHLVTGIWLGNDDNSPTKKATGGGLPVEVWTRFMKAAHQNVAPVDLPAAPAPDPITSFFSGRSDSRQANAPQSILPAQGSPQGSAQSRYVPSQAAPSPRPVQTAVRPEAGLGLDGWLVDRLFGR